MGKVVVPPSAGSSQRFFVTPFFLRHAIQPQRRRSFFERLALLPFTSNPPPSKIAIAVTAAPPRMPRAAAVLNLRLCHFCFLIRGGRRRFAGLRGGLVGAKTPAVLRPSSIRLARGLFETFLKSAPRSAEPINFCPRQLCPLRARCCLDGGGVFAVFWWGVCCGWAPAVRPTARHGGRGARCAFAFLWLHPPFPIVFCGFWWITTLCEKLLRRGR
ncbi:hypothetical protein DQ04_13891020 [Trypanosoma grayi]|uniref:hypothetical protein n=1 Tax=Trypanosoma grayi TaxID=71804 RepID=UPI0004F45927|nr:hypothetical protein DQ04_13891020 [Trypanosoma grayi]KEG06446.1 hypothetical protein DQ04_13891020 [Trypanosoma grayi]